MDLSYHLSLTILCYLVAVEGEEDAEEEGTAVGEEKVEDMYLSWLEAVSMPPIPKVIKIVKMNENNNEQNNGGRTNSNKNYSRTESLHFLSILEEHLPVGPCI